MPRILESVKQPILLYSGFDCDIYKISSKHVYKHYAPYKLGYILRNRRSPAKMLSKIKCPHIERVLEFDDEGFVTDSLNFTAGTYLCYNFPVPKEECLKAINSLSEFFYHNNIIHNDIHPSNIMYDDVRKRVILIDWTQYSESNRDVGLDRWRDNVLSDRISWFDKIDLPILCWAIRQKIYREIIKNMDITIDLENIIKKVDLEIKNINYNFTDPRCETNTINSLVYENYNCILEKEKEIILENMNKIRSIIKRR